ncbi:flagellar hook-associated protein FlgL [Pseudomonadota bacterium]
MVRISTNLFFQRSTNAMLEQQSNLSHTQLQMATGERILMPSEDPSASSRILGLNGAIDTLSQYLDNANFVSSRLAQEEDAISSATNLLQRANQLAVQGNHDIYSTSDKGAIAAEIRELLSAMISLGNSRDVNGEYIFSGYQANTRAFSQTAAGVFEYHGDQGQRALQVSAERTVADGDNGLSVFMDVDTGPYGEVLGIAAATFNEIPDGDLTINGIGLGRIPAAADAAERADQLRDAINVISDVTHVYAEFDTTDTLRLFSSAGDITIAGIAPTADTGLTAGVTAASTGKRSVFSTLDELATALESGSVSVDRYINDVQEALTHMSEIRGSIGARMRTAEDQMEINGDVRLTLESQRSDERDLDYAEAIARFNQQTLALQAAQQAYVKVQNLSLFNFLR